jgi:membrane protein YqaA with SNARE-associated domain
MSKKIKWKKVVPWVIVGLLIFVPVIIFLPKFRILAGFFLYILAACTILPFPVDIGAFAVGAFYPPWLVALVGGIAASIAGFIDYFTVSYLMKVTRMEERLKNKKYYKKARDWFQRGGFVCIIISGFTTILFDVFRILACVTNYNRKKYAAAIFIGKTPRFFIEAKFGAVLLAKFSPWIYLVLLIMIIIVIIRTLLEKKGNSKNEKNGAAKNKKDH